MWQKIFGRLRSPDRLLKSSSELVQRVHGNVTAHAAQMPRLQVTYLEENCDVGASPWLLSLRAGLFTPHNSDQNSRFSVL